MVFNPIPVFSSNRALIGPHHMSIQYSTNESPVLLKTPEVWEENTGAGVQNPWIICPLMFTLFHTVLIRHNAAIGADWNLFFWGG